MLHAVVDCDGFTGAANRLHLSQSAISYAIAQLQEQIGIPLLKKKLADVLHNLSAAAAWQYNSGSQELR